MLSLATFQSIDKLYNNILIDLTEQYRLINYVPIFVLNMGEIDRIDQIVVATFGGQIYRQ